LTGEQARAKRSIPRTGARRRGDSVTLRALLEQDLRAGRWREGERLPTERELSAHYDVARNTIRRALAILEEGNLIVRHVGRGTYRAGGDLGVKSDPFEAESIEKFSPADVVECRLIFEPGLAPLVVARATKADLDRMAECLRHAELSSSLIEFERWDAALHDAIAAATHNQAAISMSRSLAKVRQQAQWGILKARSMTPERKAKLHEEHRAIVSAISNRDQSQAHAVLRAHLLHVRSYMFGE
jgi:DNA-binding FadR family transcriptional regulator